MGWLGGEFGAVGGTMRNFVPERVVRGEGGGRQRIQVEDGTVAIVEYANGTQGLLQSSYIAIGNYPGIEIRIYGSKGAAGARLVQELRIAQIPSFAPPQSRGFPHIHLPPRH